MPTKDDIDVQQQLLAAHRRTLALYLQQQAQLGTMNATPAIIAGVQDARQNIRNIKAVLRNWNSFVEDLPNDETNNALIVMQNLSQENETSTSSVGLPVGANYKNVREAWQNMLEDCQSAETISIVGIRGLGAFGIDQSLVSLAQIQEYKQLRKLRILLLSEDSRWLNQGYIKLRAHESIDTFRKELRVSHDIMEAAMVKLSKVLGVSKSGIRYYLGEPKFGMVITDKVAYINSYAENASIQVVNLPYYRFEKLPGSLYSAFKRFFDDLWHNQSIPGKFQKDYVDLETSAGGIVIAVEDDRKYVALLRRHDGYWVLPKGHRMQLDNTLQETAIREVIEETGLKVEDFYIEKDLGYYTYDETAERFNATKVTHLFLMHCRANTKPTLNSTEFAEARWWDINIPLPEMLYTYQKSYLQEVIQSELLNTP